MKSVMVVAGLSLLCMVFLSIEATVFKGQGLPERWRNEKLDLCSTCIQFSEQAISNLLNIILNAGVVGGCSELCGLLANKTGSSAVGSVCNILCDIVGVQEFAHLIQEADLDPIYYCELMKICSVNDQSDANITSLTVSPKSGPQGTKFQVDLKYDSVNGTGTGEIAISVKTVDGIPLQSTFLLKSQNAGMYSSTITVNAQPDPDCDPTQQMCENWLPGDYTATVAVCYGECGSKHPHSKILSEKTVTFTITK